MKTLIAIIRSVVALAGVAGLNFLSAQYMKTNFIMKTNLRKVVFGGTRFSLLCAASKKQFPVRTTRVTSLLPLLLLLTLPAAVQAQYNYLTNNGAITITGYTGPGGAVAIPDTINGLPVTRIGEYAFQEKTSLTSVTIPNSVTSIGGGAFYGCTSLTDVTIPNSVTNIAANGFAWCTSLTNVTIPNSVASIGGGAFYVCTSLTSVTIPNSVTSIGSDAFFFCTSLTNVTIPNSVTSIGDYAFSGCTSLTSVTIPNSVTSIGLLAFSSCTNLTSFTIGNRVTSIAVQAFGGCTSLTSVTIPNSVTSIGDQAFFGCASLTSVTIPNSVTRIGDGALFACTSLTGVYFQGNAPSASLDVFEGDTNATVYYLPGTTGWGTTFAGRPTKLWSLPNPLILNNGPGFGVQTNGFGFIISWATNISVVVEACSNLANPIWSPVGTNTLTGGSSYFSDPQWTNHPARIYRLRSP